MSFLKPFRCSHCNKRLVVMDTEHSVLPVEIPEGDLIYDDDERFDSKKHKSHLLNCPKLQAEWQKKKMKFIKQRNALAAFAPANLEELTR